MSGTGGWDQAHLLAQLAAPGCALCRAEQEAASRFFFWYLAEHYFESESLAHLAQARGFCPHHTTVLLAHASPSTLAHVYAHLMRFGLVQLNRLSGYLRRLPPARVARRLAPEALCPACAAENEARDLLWHLLIRLLHRAEVVDASARGPILCLPHFRRLAPDLNGQALGHIAGWFLQWLTQPQAEEADWLLGVTAADGFPAQPRSVQEVCHGPFGGFAAAAPGDVPRDARRALRRWLAMPGCPLCHAGMRAGRRYLEWLAAELPTAPPAHWEEALFLCPEHLSVLRMEAPRSGLSRLMAAMRDHWVERVAALAEAGPSGRHAAALLRQGPCPACRARALAERRLADLLARGLLDPRTAHCYRESDGVCFRHVPMALEACAGRREAEMVLDAQRVRLQILVWELAEFQRKQAWEARHEPAGPETGAPRRAVAQYAGLCLNAPATTPQRAG